MKRRSIRAAAAALLVLLPGLLLSAAASPHAAAAGPAVTVTPNANLVGGQWVKVTFSGFTPGGAVVGFRQCIANPVHVATDCNSWIYYQGDFSGNISFDANGGGDIYLPIYSSGDPNLANAGNTGAIPCDNTHPCVLAVLGNTTDLTGAVFAPLPFAPDVSVCPSPGSNAVFGTGAATAYRAIYQWQVASCVAPYSLPTIFGVSNSVDGIDNFGQGQQQANFAVTGPVPPSELALPSTAPSFKLAPITSSALVIAYRLFDRRGNQVTNLTLTPFEISQIFQSKLSLASDPGVASLNPGVQFPFRYSDCVRAEHSAETYVFTSWMTALLGKGVWAQGPQTIYPDIGALQHASGSRGVANCVYNPDQLANGLAMFGYMDSSTAAFYGLPAVRIRMPSGSFVSPTPTSIAEDVSLATQNSDGSWAPAYTPADPLAYPMSYPTYLVAPTNQIAGDQGKTLAGFLRYAVQQGQTNLPAGYTPLPAVMVNQSLAVADLIPTTGTGTAGSGGGLVSGDTASSLAPDNGLNNDLANGIPNGDLGPGGSSPGSAGAGAIGGKPKPTASGPPIPAMALSGSMGRWMLLGIAALALFGVVAGPLTLLMARPWPPPWLRRVLRVLPLRAGKPVTS